MPTLRMNQGSLWTGVGSPIEVGNKREVLSELQHSDLGVEPARISGRPQVKACILHILRVLIGMQVSGPGSDGSARRARDFSEEWRDATGR
jgi:hypothetical protein